MNSVESAAASLAPPSLALRAMGAASQVYARVFADSPAAPVLSRRNPVRRSGFDLELRLAQTRTEAEDVVSLTLVSSDGAQLPGWVPGAHLDVFLPSGRQRQYSLCGDPADRTRYRIAVRRIADGGGGSREVHEALTVGDLVCVRGPRNAFTFIDAPSYLFLAGGIGITPILPMVRAAAATAVDWNLVYAGRSRVSMPFIDELVAVAGPRLELRPDDEVGLPDVPAIVARAKPGAAIYVCGPPLLLAEVRRVAAELNPTASLHAERFSPPPVTGGAPFEVRLQRSDRTIAVGAEESALAAIRRELPDIVYSCQQGFCGTCKVHVLAGAVEHRDSVLLDAERTDSMLICISRAADAQLVLDL